MNNESELIALKNGIISKISHEYRTPLTVIQTSTELLKIYYEIKDKQKFDEAIDRINTSIEKMIKFLEDIVLLGKIESKMIDLNYEKVDIFSYIDSIITHYRTSHKNLQKIYYNKSGNNKIFNIELNLINIIFTRLLTNAINFSPKESEIKIEIHTTQDNFTVCIQDEGYGISPDKLENIFNPYKRFLEKDFTDGTGFGLAIVKESVNLMNGEINISSEINKGTTITFSIPDKK
jgi:signal transduction histidine kinase